MSDDLRNTFRHGMSLHMDEHGPVFSPCRRLVALFLLWRYGTRQAMWNSRLCPCCYRSALSSWGGHEHRHGAGHGCHSGGTRTVRSTAVGNTTDKMKKGIKDAAGAVKHAVEKGKDAAVRAVDKGEAAAARGVNKVKDKTDRAADKIKHA